MAGVYDNAPERFGESGDAAPGDAEYWFRFGAAAHRQGDLSAARAAFVRASALDPRHTQICFALSTVCLELGDSAAALAACRDAVALAPSEPRAWFSLAYAQECADEPEAALASYDQALRIAPEFGDARKNRGALLLKLGRVDEAIENNRRLAAQLPFAYDAQFNLGDALLAARQYPEAARVLGRALVLAPGNVKALLHTGFALAQCERFVEAQRLLDRASEIDPLQVRRYRAAIFGPVDEAAADDREPLDARVLFLLRHYERIERADWTEHAHFVECFSRIVREAGERPLTERALAFRALVMGLPGNVQLTLARQIASALPTVPPASLLVQRDTKRPPAADREGRLRVGYLSPNFRQHPAGLLAQSLFEWHDREHFEVFVYALGGNDGSVARARIAAGADHFVELAELDDDAAAQRIAGDCIDLLVEVMGYAAGTRPGILARRPAPLQLSWLEYMAPSGAPWIDYFISDTICLPNDVAQHFDEAVIRLPRGRLLCSYAGDPLPPPPARVAVGLPEGGPVLGAFHSPCKIDPGIFSVWMRFLRQCPAATLYLLDTRTEATDRLRTEARVRGVDAERLVFAQPLPHADHLARFQLVDLMLDTPQYNGGATTADALVAGVPVLACLGETVAQRMAASMLESAGLAEMVSADLHHYERLGSALLADPERLRAVRQRLGAQRTTAAFFAPRMWVRDYEKSLQQAWRIHCADEPAQSFTVGA